LCISSIPQDSQSIINCFLREAKRLGVEIKTGMGVKALRTVGEMLELQFLDEEFKPEVFDKIIVTTGGSPKREGLN